jgi:NAD(P)-dependent dehydrogenase (short-subunit alcohol dehydrogenase family)
MSEKLELRGQVAIVTGGGRGIGRAAAQLLASRGASVAVVSRTRAEVDETAAAIARGAGRALAIAADVTDSAAVAALAARVERELGAVDLLVNAAGVARPYGPSWEVDPGEWWRAFEVNVRGAFLCARAVLPGMIARRRGRIVNVSSGSGNVAFPYVSAYCASKAALTRWTEVVAAEAREHGVSAFAIEPGTVRTAMTEDVLRGPEGRRWIPWFSKIFEDGRDVTPEHAADLVATLASGRLDALSGCFLSRADDLDALLARADEIRRTGALTLRLRPP